MRFGAVSLLIACSIGPVAIGCDRKVPDAKADRWATTLEPLTDTPVEPRDAGSCTATLSGGTVTPTRGCWVDEKVGSKSATLTYTCGGGPASADFAVPFSGKVDADGQVDLAATTTFTWPDGCTWQSEQRIKGTLGSGTLAYSYREKPVRGASCSSSHCTADAKITAK